MTFYIYIIENKLNGMRYLGRRKGKGDPLTDGYFGSGKNITKAISEEGLTNFTKTIHSTYSSLSELILAEDRLLKETNAAQDPAWYNMSTSGRFGGDGTGLKSRNHGKRKSDAHRLALANAKRGKPNGQLGQKRNLTNEQRDAWGARQRGEKSSVYDHTEYHFVNVCSLEEYVGTKQNFSRKYNLCNGNVSRICKGQTHYKDWRLKQNELMPKPIRGPSIDKTIYTMDHSSHASISGNRDFLRQRIGIDSGNLSKIITGKKHSFKGWSLCPMKT